MITKAKSIKDKVRETIVNTEDLGSISLMELLVDALGEVEQTVHEDMLRRFTVSGVTFTEDALLHDLIPTSPYEEDDKLLHAIYTYCLMWDTDYRVVLKREVNEAYVVQYEPHVLEATQANHSMEIVTRTPEVLYDYVTKRAECVSEEAEKMKMDLDGLGHRMKATHIMATAADHREVSQSEAYFRIDPTLEMARTNLRVAFINTKFPERRSRRYQKVGAETDTIRRGEQIEEDDEFEGEDDARDIEERHRSGVSIEGKEGLFIPRENMLEKYAMMPDILKLLVLAQFVMNYILATPTQSASLKKKFQDQEQIPDSNVMMAMSNDDAEGGDKFLPSRILLKNGSFMIQTRKPAVIQPPRLTVEHELEYSDLLLYSPWSSEEQDLGDALADMGICSYMHGRMDRNPKITSDGRRLTKIETIKSRLKISAGAGKTIYLSLLLTVLNNLRWG